MKRVLIVLSLFSVFTLSAAWAQTCLDCHKKLSPAIVSDWQLSKHSHYKIGCAACHGDRHKSATDVAQVQIPTPDTCGKCHAERVAQFKKGKHALGWASMNAMPIAHMLPTTLAERPKRMRRLPQNRPEKREGNNGPEEKRFNDWRCFLRRLSYPAHLFGGGSQTAPGMPDLSHRF